MEGRDAAIDDYRLGHRRSAAGWGPQFRPDGQRLGGGPSNRLDDGASQYPGAASMRQLHDRDALRRSAPILPRQQ